MSKSEISYLWFL